MDIGGENISSYFSAAYIAQPIGELENVLDVHCPCFPNWEESLVCTIHMINIPFSVKHIRNMLQNIELILHEYNIELGQSS